MAVFIALAVVIFGTVAIVIISIGREPPIVLEPGFLLYRLPFRRPISVRYRDIKSLYSYAASSQQFVVIEPYDVPAALAAVDARTRRRLSSALRWVGAPYILPNSVKLNADQLSELIVSYIDADAFAAGAPALHLHNGAGTAERRLRASTMSSTRRVASAITSVRQKARHRAFISAQAVFNNVHSVAQK